MTIGSIVETGMRCWGNLIAGNGSEVLTSATKSAMKTYKTYNSGAVARGLPKLSAKNMAINVLDDGFSALAKNSASVSAKSILQGMKSQVAGIPGGARAGWQTAAASGKGFFGKVAGATKGLGGGLGKAMPVIGTALMVAFELPNIVSATKDKGLLAGGAVETAKAGVKLGAGFAGAAIGQALIPIPLVGSIVGFMAGNWLATKIVGKSHTEKKVEEAQKQQQQMAQMMQQIQYPPINPFQQVA
jgi:hypothetical protein